MPSSDGSGNDNTRPARLPGRILGVPDPPETRKYVFLDTRPARYPRVNTRNTREYFSGTKSHQNHP